MPTTVQAKSSEQGSLTMILLQAATDGRFATGMIKPAD